MLPKEQYKKYAAARMNINKILPDQYLEKNDLKRSGQALGLFKKGAFVFNSDVCSDAVVDFAVRYLKRKGQTGIEHAIGDNIWRNNFEEEFLKGLSNATCSLFEIQSTDAKTGCITIKDILDSKNTRYELNDIGASLHLYSGIYMYLSIVHVGEGYVTNGVAFGYDPRFNEMIRFELIKSVNRSKLKDADKRYKLFFKLFQKMGAKMEGRDVE